MARKTVMLCDACGKEKDVAEVIVLLGGMKGERFTADLCGVCRKRMFKDYHISDTMQARTVMKIWDYDDIPRNTT